MSRYGIRGLGFNPLTANQTVTIDDKTRVLIVRGLLRAADEIFARRMIEDRIINRKLRPFVEGRNWTRDCAGYGKQIVVTPEGRVGVCHGLWPDFVNETVRNFFDIDVEFDGVIKDHPTWVEWFHRTPFNMPQCWDCLGIGLCGGGCARNSLLKSGSIWEIDGAICTLVKEAIPWVIWKYYDEKLGKL